MNHSPKEARELIRKVRLEDGTEVAVYNPLFHDALAQLQNAKGPMDVMKGMILASTDLTSSEYHKLTLHDGMVIMDVIHKSMEAFKKYAGMQ